MARSSTQSMENFTAQGMEQHQMMMNTEMMKQHARIMNRASVREIMLQHEKTFKEQVHDLHKLYEVQRLLMDKAKSRGLDGAGLPSASPRRGNVVSEDTNQGQRSNFWEQIVQDSIGVVKGGAGSPSKTIPDRTVKLQEVPKSVNSPIRKRKIDLEQLPEDDSDDELQNSVATVNQTSSSLSGNSRELPKVYSGFETTVKSNPGPHGGQQVSSGLQALQTIKHSQATSFLSGKNSLYMESSGNRDDALYPSHLGNGPPSLPLNVMKIEQSFTNLGERTKPYQNPSAKSTGVPLNNNAMFLPQADLIDRASQETEKQTHWFFQASEAHVANSSIRFPAHQLQPRPPSHIVLSEHSSSKGHPPTANLDQRHLNKTYFEEGVGGIFGKPSPDRHSPGLATAAQKENFGALTERLGDASKWFTKATFEQVPLGNVVPTMARFETGLRAGGGHSASRFETGLGPEGGHSVPGLMTPASNAASSKGPSHERELGLWSTQTPILQLPQYQQPPIFQQQGLPLVSQAMWGPPSQIAQHSLYSQQQAMYGLHASDPPQVGYRGEGLQRNQGDMAGSWNMIGLGHYYSSLASSPQKPPFKKPPKLVLKNDGVGMELKLVSPEDLSEKERAGHKKALNVVKRDAPQTSSKTLQHDFLIQKVVEEGHKVDTRTTSEVLLSSSSMQRDQSNKVGASMEAQFLTTASCLSTLAPSHCASTSITLASSLQQDHGAFATSTSGPEIGSGFHVSTLANGSISQQIVFPSPDKEKSVGAVPGKETLPLSNTNASKGVQGQAEEIHFSKAELDVNPGFGSMEEIKEPLNKMLVLGQNSTDGIAKCQSETFTKTQGSQSKCLEDGAMPADTSQLSSQNMDLIKGSPSPQDVDAESLVKDLPEIETSCNVTSTCPTSSQPGGGSTDMPSILKQETKKYTELLDDFSSQRVPEPSGAECKNESGSPHSGKESEPVPSLTTFMSESKVEAVVGALNEELQHDLDTDNLAASILLSFAPKVELPNAEKLLKDSLSEVSSSFRKVKTADQGNKKSRTDNPESISKPEGRKLQGPSSGRRIDKADHPHHQHDHMKLTMKDWHKRENTNSAECHTEEGEVVMKGLTIKLPRVASSMPTDEAVPISRSKQLSNKLNRVTSNGNPGECFKNAQKGSETTHTPTGRRSSRGPSVGTRLPQEIRSRLHQQALHRVEYSSSSPMEKDFGTREEGGRSGNKLEGNVKSKAWGELNRTRSTLPRKQFPDLSHRKSQK